MPLPQHMESAPGSGSGRHRPSAISGEMATRFREFDWGSTPIGPSAQWPESWRNAVRIILDSSFPTALAFGPQLIYFYNDAFIPVGGPARHPAALGLPVPVGWKEIWTQILEPRFTLTLSTGEPTGEEDLLIPLQRSGYLEETYITFSFAALRDDRDLPNGIFCTAYETTARVIADRQLNCLRALAAQSGFAETPEEACQAATAILEGNPRDLPFALLYLIDGQQAQLCGTSGLVSVPDTVPQTIDLTGGNDVWRISAVSSSRAAALVDSVQTLIGNDVRTPEVTPARAFALPISDPVSERPAGVLIAGVNPMRPLEESRAFHELIASQLETSISNARAKQNERERVRALADLDRAKTLFFSNISHELRTPLTLLLGPLNDVLSSGSVQPTERELLQIAQRGGRRLLKLVNSLLEFSRIEAGRIEAAYEPADLATLTADLASVFRSAFERAGVALRIDCPPLPEPVFVDADMWEKIVLNLISNAFKFTLYGEVHVRLRALAGHVELEIADTGCGVAADDLPRLFERFFRGRSPQSRTHEGSGIGLSLVQELVKLHGGTVQAHSQLGRGTTFTVCIPRGSQHLTPDRIGAVRKLARADTGALPFVEEALGWLPNFARGGGAHASEASPSIEHDARPERDPKSGSARILVVDDNADMRDYLGRLLGSHWQVDTAPDSSSALEQISHSVPDLVIADIMMPGIDGFGLLRLLRDNQRTSGLPVMLLSARAGEEASEEALRAGADDYVIKPFSARELLARVDARLAQAKLRAAERRAREAAERANRARDDFFATLSHELRTPLMAILGWTALLKSDRLNDADAAAVDLIDRNARVQRRLINDLLDMARIVTGRMRIELQPLASFSELVGVVVDSFRPIALAKGISVYSTLDADTGPLEGDPERLQQVLWNLLSNAIRFTPAGGRIEILCQRSEEDVEVIVRDSGRGIRPEAVPHLFERYWQGQFDSHPGQGLGLGLAIAQRIVSLHSGTVWAASEGEGLGATFTVRLPISDSIPGASARIAASPSALGAYIRDAAALAAGELNAPEPEKIETLEAGAPDALRILLIDDHDAIAKACQRLLASHGHTVVRAGGLSGAMRALQEARVSHAPFDIVICDLSLPDGDGAELPARMTAFAATSDATTDIAAETPPAMAISGRVFKDDVARCLAAGFREHLAKPFDETELLAAVKRVARKPGRAPVGEMLEAR
jgi:signal transduction histidine kinase/methylmalonyl-CoA mutase cobalamin-binding subunit